MAQLDRNWLRTLYGWRVIGVLGICLVMSPVWMLLTPIGWVSVFGGEDGRDFVGAAATLGGSLAVGSLFLLLTHLRGKPPSVWFALLVPAIGTVASGLLAMVFDGQGPSLFGPALYSLLGAMWLYWYVALFALPIAFAHTALMILIAGETVHPRTNGRRAQRGPQRGLSNIGKRGRWVALNRATYRVG